MTGDGPLLVDVEGHGRIDYVGDLDPSRSVGWFAVLFPVQLHVSAAQPPPAALRAVEQQLATVPNAGLHFGLLRDYGPGDVRAALAAMPRRTVLCEFMGRTGGRAWQARPFRVSDLPRGRERGTEGLRSHELEVLSVIRDDRLEVRIAYSRNLHRDETIAELQAGIADFVRGLAGVGDGEPASGDERDFLLAGLDSSALSRIGKALES